PNLPLNAGLDHGLYYLHGYFNSDESSASVRTLVFGERSFEEAYGDSLLPGFLLSVLVYSNILFIAFNPLESHIALLLARSARIRRRIAANTPDVGSTPARFILRPNRTGLGPEEQAKEDDTLRQLRTLEITPILYDRKGEDYRGLEMLLYGWVEEGDQ